MPSKGRPVRHTPEADRGAGVAVAAEDDAAAFAQAVRGARQLGGVPKVSPLMAAPVPAPPPRRPLPVAPPPLAAALTSAEGGSAAGHAWTLRADGVDRRMLRKLRAGEIPVEAELDLHGLTRARAAAAVDRFLAAARAGGRRSVLIIHGRGLHSGTDGPALRDAVRAALTGGIHAAAVLACCAAPPARGGAGATVVLLRRREP
ncbi:MAG: Smr/MutS family protein [Myxococcales bacterium]